MVLVDIPVGYAALLYLSLSIPAHTDRDIPVYRNVWREMRERVESARDEAPEPGADTGTVHYTFTSYHPPALLIIRPR